MTLTVHESRVLLEAVIPDMNGREQSGTVAICRTCPRDRPHSGAVGLSLYNEIKERLTSQGMTVMMVHCLGSCRTPCAVALDAPAKPRVRLSGLKDVNAVDRINAALEYWEAASGDVTVAMLPALLQQHVSATSPKRKRSAA
ncbi:UNVERIFIED_ORG: putative metal-binding protein [Paraburkholderia sediminicola]|nr:putative metal-binding protein [Paraburkholderia sediminicola]